MEDSNKLFVFERKEVLLLFLFVLLIAAAAFTLGLRMGKSLNAGEEFVDTPESQNINLKSDAEEDVDDIIAKKEETSFEDSLEGEGRAAKEKEPVLDDLTEKFKDVANGDSKPEPEVNINTDTKPDINTAAPETQKATRELSGKWTIQLVSRKSRELAVEFAEPFDAAGYDIIINKVDIPTRGTWYRVSIGAFESKAEAQNYMKSEEELFQGKEYIVKQFK